MELLNPSDDHKADHGFVTGGAYKWWVGARDDDGNYANQRMYPFRIGPPRTIHVDLNNSGEEDGSAAHQGANPYSTLTWG